MKIILLAALVLMVSSQANAQTSGQAQAQPCWNDKVRNSSGAVLALSSGQIFRVYPGGSRITSAWLPLDKLIVCPIGGSAVEITNTSEKDQKVKALRSN